MGKGLEAFLAVIASHTAFTEAAEWHFAGGEVMITSLIQPPPKPHSEVYFFTDGFVLGKNVKSQRMSHGIYLSDYFFYGIKSKDRHYRSEDFFLHDSVRKGDVVHDCWLDL